VWILALAIILLPGAAHAAPSLPSGLTAQIKSIAVESGIIKPEPPKPKLQPIPEPVPEPVPLPPPPPLWQISVADSGYGSVGYPYGQCTWIVAQYRSVNWYGNAGQWWWTAPPYIERGQVPRPGAIYVGWDNSWYGHVAYVTATYDENTWTMLEMNYAGWGVTNYRTVNRWEVPLQGFLY